MRVPIGSSDFYHTATPAGYVTGGSYTYDDMPPGQSDPTLANFSIGADVTWTIPIIQQALRLNPRLSLMASPWSPPAWMKTEDRLDNLDSNNYLLPAAYGPLATYVVKFLQAYAGYGIHFFAVTPQNEPGQFTDYNGMNLPVDATAAASATTMAVGNEADLVRGYLGPALVASGLGAKILGFDSNWVQNYPFTLAGDLANDAQAGSYLQGMAWHCYEGDVEAMAAFHALYPGQEQDETECASGVSPGDPAEAIIASVRNWANGALVWNVALDQAGGPRQGNGCDECFAPVRVVDATTPGTYTLTSDYYQLGQASKFVQPGAYRVDSSHFAVYQAGLLLANPSGANLSTSYANPMSSTVDDAAFVNPDGSRVLLAYNASYTPRSFKIRVGNEAFTYANLPSRGTVTFVWGTPNGSPTPVPPGAPPSTPTPPASATSTPTSRPSPPAPTATGPPAPTATGPPAGTSAPPPTNTSRPPGATRTATAGAGGALPSATTTAVAGAPSATVAAGGTIAASATATAGSAAATAARLSPTATTVPAPPRPSRGTPRGTPRLTLSPATAQPSTRVTVHGSGFAPGEMVTLALDGAALATSPAVITTSRSGAFTASFIAGSTLLNGANTVSALGNRRGDLASAALSGRLSVAAQVYLAGGSEAASEHATLQLLNPSRQRATARLTLYFDTGAPESHVLRLPATTQHSVPIASLTHRRGPFGLALTADRPIATQLDLSRTGQDGDSILANTGLGTTWYLAEGYTGLTFHESVSLLNPDPLHPAQVQLRLLPFGGRRARTLSVRVPAHTERTVDINRLLPRQSLSIVAISTRPIALARTLSFSTGSHGAGYGLTTRAGAAVAATSWLFAEGSTVNRFQTFLTLLNSGDRPAHVTALFHGSSGGLLATRRLLVAARSRATLVYNRFLHASGIAATVLSDRPIVVERPEYFGSPNGARIAGSDVIGRNGVASQWSFPAGATSRTRRAFLLLYNPSARTIAVEVTLYGSDGRTLTTRIFVPATVRYTLDVGRVFAGRTGTYGATLRSVTGAGFVAEQTVFAPNHSTLQSTQGLAQ